MQVSLGANKLDEFSDEPCIGGSWLLAALCRCPYYADVGLQVIVSGGARCEGVGIILGAQGW